MRRVIGALALLVVVAGCGGPAGPLYAVSGEGDSPGHTFPVAAAGTYRVRYSVTPKGANCAFSFSLDPDNGKGMDGDGGDVAAGTAENKESDPVYLAAGNWTLDVHAITQSDTDPSATCPWAVSLVAS